MSQEAQILAHLEAGNTLTPLEALAKFKCFRLSGRILDLKKKGHPIITETHEMLDGKRVAKYRLVKPMFPTKQENLL